MQTDTEQGSWERNRRNLEQMERGDRLLIYRNSESRYTATGRASPMTHTEYIRDEHWDGDPAIDVYVVGDYEQIDVNRDTVNPLLGYEESFSPQGF